MGTLFTRNYWIAPFLTDTIDACGDSLLIEASWDIFLRLLIFSIFFCMLVQVSVLYPRVEEVKNSDMFS